MASRVTDEQVIHTLLWAQHYKDVEQWERISSAGPKWLVTLTRQSEVKIDGGHGLIGRAADVVPKEMVLTNREVLLFAYGLAVGGERDQTRGSVRHVWNSEA